MVREWQKGMGEISGFGGSYEEACRAMVLTGINWIDEHPNAELKVRGYEGVFGLTKAESNEAKELERAFMDARVKMEDGREIRCGDECTGAMIHATWLNLFAYHKLGWDGYVKERMGNE